LFGFVNEFLKAIMKNNKSKLRKRIKKGFSKKLKIVPKIKLNVPENSTENIKIKFRRKVN
jgi:hypothetical protein